MSQSLRHEELFYEADLDIKDGRFETAVTKLEGIISENPRFGKAYNHLGWLYETKFKNFNLAERYYKLALENAPNYTAGYTNYAILLSTLNKFDELKVHLDKAIDVPGIDKATIYNEYGILYEQQGDFKKAIQYYRDCAKRTLNKDTMNRALDSIDRCKVKLDL